MVEKKIMHLYEKGKKRVGLSLLLFFNLKKKKLKLSIHVLDIKYRVRKPIS
jgi:hypothetical protein